MKILAFFAAIFGGVFLARSGKTNAPDFPFPSPSPDSPADAPSDAPGDVSLTDTPETILEAATPPESPAVVDIVVDAVANKAAEISALVFGTKYDTQIIAAANQYGIAPKTFYNLLFAESHFREDIITGKVRSSTGALGIAQFMPATAIQELGSINAALDPNRAIPGSARYLAKLIRQAGSIDAGVAAYNWGIGNVQRKGLVNAPAETVNYVFNITGANIHES